MVKRVDSPAAREFEDLFPEQENLRPLLSHETLVFSNFFAQSLDCVVLFDVDEAG